MSGEAWLGFLSENFSNFLSFFPAKSPRVQWEGMDGNVMIIPSPAGSTYDPDWV
jgi:hypothetical protein